MKIRILDTIYGDGSIPSRKNRFQHVDDWVGVPDSVPVVKIAEQSIQLVEKECLYNGKKFLKNLELEQIDEGIAGNIFSQLFVFERWRVKEAVTKVLDMFGRGDRDCYVFGDALTYRELFSHEMISRATILVRSGPCPVASEKLLSIEGEKHAKSLFSNGVAYLIREKATMSYSSGIFSELEERFQDNYIASRMMGCGMMTDFQEPYDIVIGNEEVRVVSFNRY